MTERDRQTLLILGNSNESLRAACYKVFPDANLVAIEAAALSRLSPATALIVGKRTQARVARATGFIGAIVVLDTPTGADELSSTLAQGIHFADPGALPASLADALTTACAVRDGRAASPVDPGLARTRRLLAAGELALGLQHAFNNPLTALMTEVQLLQLDAPSDSVRASAARMLDLVRRLTEISRSLDAVRDPSSPGS